MNITIVSEAILINNLIEQLIKETYPIDNISSFTSIVQVPMDELSKSNLLCLILKEHSLNDFELAIELKKSYQHIKILVIDLSFNRNLIRDIIQNNIDGYLIGSINKTELLSAINLLLTNKKYYDSNSIHNIINKTNFYLCNNLTNREKEIFNHMVKGITNKDISKLTHISESTTKKHVSNILRKLNFKDRRELLLHTQNNNNI